MFELEAIKTQLSANILVNSVDTVRKGHIRIATGFVYPDGSSIDVFLKQPDRTILSELDKPVLTDFANTWSWLQTFEMKPNRTITQKTWFDSILNLYSCRFNGAAIECELDSIDDLPIAIIRLGQACLRTSDLIYSKRFRAQSNFNSEVEEIIANINSEYQAEVELPLGNGNIVKIDFLIHGKKRETAVQTLSSGNASSAHVRANEIFVRWNDIIDLSEWPSTGGQCVTIFDDSSNIYDAKDLSRLERKSILVPFSNSEILNDILSAA